MSIFTKLFGIEPPPPPPPDSEDDETAEAVMARNADVRSVIDATLDEWRHDLETITGAGSHRRGPANSLREARHWALPL